MQGASSRHKESGDTEVAESRGWDVPTEGVCNPRFICSQGIPDHFYPVLGLSPWLCTELKWDLFIWKHSYSIPVLKDHSFLTLHIFCGMTPGFLASPGQKTPECLWKCSQLDVCPLLNHIQASQVIYLPGKNSWVICVSYSQSDKTRTSERAKRILPMIHPAQHLAFSWVQQEIPWEEHQNRKTRHLLSAILRFPLIWARGLPDKR